VALGAVWPAGRLVSVAVGLVWLVVGQAVTAMMRSFGGPTDRRETVSWLCVPASRRVCLYREPALYPAQKTLTRPSTHNIDSTNRPHEP
jgi:hypothetical protein